MRIIHKAGYVLGVGIVLFGWLFIFSNPLVTMLCGSIGSAVVIVTEESRWREEWAEVKR